MRPTRSYLIASALLLCAEAQQPAQLAPTGPVSLTLQDALGRARAYSPQFQSAVVAAASAHEDVVQSKAGFFPTVNYFNQ